MTMDTDAFIRRLADQLEPVQPISGPWIRTGTWLALAIPSILFLVLVKSPRADLASKLSDPEFVLEQVAALATGAAAATAAFASVIPGYRPKLAALPLVPLAVWLGSLGHGCVQDWLRLGPHGLALRSDWSCIIAIAKIGAVPAGAIVLMLRRSAPLSPHLTMALGGLAAAGLGNFALRLVHTEDASMMVLVWQFGAVCALSMVLAGAGRYLLSWRAIRGGRHGIAPVS